MQLSLDSNKNKKEVNKDIYLNVNFDNKSDIIPTSDISGIVNTYAVFENERNTCTKYRLNVTINPTTTNVLINPITRVYNGTTEITGTTRVDAINTINQNYTYKFGYDIFDNHYFRADVFKIGTTLNDFTGTEMSEVKTIEKSISDNLYDDNGWMCFYNKTKITGDLFLESKLPCDKIDLFPDRTYFSFNEEYNEFNNKIETNWEYFITYPYQNYVNSKLVQSSNGLNGIPIISGVIEIVGDKTFLAITTPYKHGLNKNDIIKINRTDPFKNKTYLVYNIGDLDGINSDYVFTLDADKYGDLKYIAGIQNNRIVRVINNIDSTYYIRKFRKLPNFKNETEQITESNIESKISSNNVAFLNDSYQLGFSRNIYGDKMHQIQYLDDINIRYLRDNLGRPLSEMYMTILKKNKYTSPTERSNIFSNLMSGVECPINNLTYNNIHNITNTGGIEYNITTSGSTGDNTFLGDIVEYNKSTVKEYVLDDIYYKFNTVDREKTSNIMTYHVASGNAFVETQINLGALKEGYYYKPHNRIPIKNYSSVVNQSEFPELDRCGSCAISGITNNDIYVPITGQSSTIFKYLVIRVTNDSTYYNLDRIRLTNKLNGKYVNANMIVRDDMENCVLIPYDYNFWGNINNIQTSILNYTIRTYPSIDIPTYCQDMGNGICMWRNILKEGVFDSDSNFRNEFEFTNGELYVTKKINLFLKRQDPFGEFGLRRNTFPTDMFGVEDDTLITDNKILNPNEIC